MSAAAVNTYKGKIDRGTMTLAQCDQAERGKLVTAAEAQQLRDYWHAVYDVVGLSLAVADGRGQTLTWTSPRSVHNLQIERKLNGSALPAFLTPAGSGSYVLPPPDEAGQVALEVTATVSNSVNGYLGGSASTSATIPPAPEPAPTPDPATNSTPDSSTPDSSTPPAADSSSSTPDSSTGAAQSDASGTGSS